ncbi:MAG TPA: glycine cleavage system aminomethyltransferase GcvT [Methylibium sp.]|uniref:glycine cleavage system aminomethyltransferase GcvT n=1 Tax=Methylibium sp. TaxID=2067992 RepID=UPI002DB5B729|nr:glycine cleavage system aminomethyltransferase GcvT [Methylibium sp.]HEU4459631.1 glycine cleavage system aminomethyltransferase GcvT [Methylibium sp.]
MTTASSPAQPALLRTPLHDLHAELGARIVSFAGYAMPVSYTVGILAEHRHCRAQAALFDVSHMGQIALRGERVAAALESLIPIDVVGLRAGQQRYGFFTAPDGGLLDDLMLTRLAPESPLGDWLLIVNAARKAHDIAHLRRLEGPGCEITVLEDRALLALQGPKAGDVVARLAPATAALRFMQGGHHALAGIPTHLTRSGYTGEDGFEISVAASQAGALARELLKQPEVKAAGLGARDTLRLEAGLCLYGHDIDASTSPIEAALGWAIQKVRRAGGARAGGYPGAAVLDAQFAQGAARRRVGLRGLELAPVREGSELVDEAGAPIGRVTSGTIGPTAEAPIAMALVAAGHAAPDTVVHALVRGKRLPMRVSPLPFVAHRYLRG